MLQAKHYCAIKRKRKCYKAKMTVTAKHYCAIKIK